MNDIGQSSVTLRSDGPSHAQWAADDMLVAFHPRHWFPRRVLAPIARLVSGRIGRWLSFREELWSVTSVEDGAELTVCWREDDK